MTLERFNQSYKILCLTFNNPSPILPFDFRERFIVMKYWMITDRAVNRGNIVDGDQGYADLVPDTFWVTENENLKDINNWQEVEGDDFKTQILTYINSLPQDGQPKQITLMIHGFDNTWEDATQNYQQVCTELFQKRNLGACILYTWDSAGSPILYFKDKDEAAKSAYPLGALFDIFVSDWFNDIKTPISIIAHSMGNYVLQKGMREYWDMDDRPENCIVANQVIMVAADIKNDLFNNIVPNQDSDGGAIANLSSRVIALYNPNDSILWVSGDIHGNLRLGESGLDKSSPVPNNVSDINCSNLVQTGQPNIHSCYFYEPKILDLMEKILRDM